MIGKAKSNSSLANTIEYHLREQSILFYRNNLVGENIDDYRMQMEDLEKCYTGYGKQLLVHAILTPAIEDGRRLDDATWTKMADMYLREMKLKENFSAIGFIHKDKEHHHCHIVISKINLNNFKLFQDSFIGKKTQHIADKIAQKFGLIRAMEIKRQNLKKKLVEQENKNQPAIIKELQTEETPRGIRQKFKQELKKIIAAKTYNNTDEYFKALRQNGFKVIKHYNDEHNLRGYSVEKDDTMMNATAIGKEFSLTKLGLVNAITTNKKTNQENTTIQKQEQKQESIQPLDNEKLKQSLYQFFKEQGIDKNTIDRSNIEFIQQGKYYYAAIKNNSNGYAVINPFSNENIGTKDIATIGNEKNADVIICEDVFDYLRQLQNNQNHNQQNEQTNYIILNEIFDKTKLQKEILRLQPKQVLYNKSQEQNLTNSISKAFTNFMDILFSDEHLTMTIGSEQQKKKELRRRPKW